MDDVDIDERASRWPDTFEPERWGPERSRRRRVVVGAHLPPDTAAHLAAVIVRSRPRTRGVPLCVSPFLTGSGLLCGGYVPNAGSNLGVCGWL
jgi:hypothetical protein